MSRLVQMQAALNEAVYVILRIQGSEVAIPCPPLSKFHKVDGIFEYPANYRNSLDHQRLEVSSNTSCLE